MSDETSQVSMLSVTEARARISDGTAYVVDVREPHENAQMRIAGSHLVPLSIFDASRITPEDGRDLILHCRIGQRCGVAANQLVKISRRQPARAAQAQTCSAPRRLVS